MSAKYFIFSLCIGLAIADLGKVTLINSGAEVYAYVSQEEACTGVTSESIGKAVMNETTGAYSTAKGQ